MMMSASDDELEFDNPGDFASQQLAVSRSSRAAVAFEENTGTINVGFNDAVNAREVSQLKTVVRELQGRVKTLEESYALLKSGSVQHNFSHGSPADVKQSLQANLEANFFRILREVNRKSLTIGFVKRCFAPVNALGAKQAPPRMSREELDHLKDVVEILRTPTKKGSTAIEENNDDEAQAEGNARSHFLAIKNSVCKKSQMFHPDAPVDMSGPYYALKVRLVASWIRTFLFGEFTQIKETQLPSVEGKRTASQHLQPIVGKQSLLQISRH